MRISQWLRRVTRLWLHGQVLLGQTPFTTTDDFVLPEMLIAGDSPDLRVWGRTGRTTCLGGRNRILVPFFLSNPSRFTMFEDREMKEIVLVYSRSHTGYKSDVWAIVRIALK